MRNAMEKIYLITEEIGSLGNDERIVGACTDRKFAMRYCQDMRVNGKLKMHEVELDNLTMPEEKLYRVEYKGHFVWDDSDDVLEAFEEIVSDNRPVAYVEEERYFLDATYGALRCLRIENDSYFGTSVSVWCYARNASSAIRIARNTVRDLDRKDLEWGLYLPTRKDNRELKRRIRKYEK